PPTNPTAHRGRAPHASHVAVPSVPRSGFSDKPTETGWNLSRIASAWSELMQRLGYRRWVAQGGDWGAGVTTALGHLLPAGLAGIHLLGEGYDYLRRQSTPPQTIEYALAVSPSDRAGWFYERS